MASKEFKSIDRDIRDHEWDNNDFDLGFTDSTCPFKSIISEIEEPGKGYTFALNHGPRIDRLIARKWNIVDPSRLANRQTFTMEKRDPEARQCITTGDTVLLERDIRYSEKEDGHLHKKNIDVMRTAMDPIKKTTVHDYLTPFRNRIV